MADAIDPLFEEIPGLAQIQGASVVGRVATGPRAGRWVVRLGRDPRAEVVIGRGRRQAHQRGFDLHADTAVGEGERDRLERLCRYVLRPPLAGDALELTEDGKVLLRRPWSDGTYAIRFEPSELLERLAAMIPRPRANQLIYHGAYAPRGVVHERACAQAPSPHGEQGGRQPSPEGTRGTAPEPESPDEPVDAGSAETAVSRSVALSRCMLAPWTWQPPRSVVAYSTPWAMANVRSSLGGLHLRPRRIAHPHGEEAQDQCDQRYGAQCWGSARRRSDNHLCGNQATTAKDPGQQ